MSLKLYGSSHHPCSRLPGDSPVDVQVLADHQLLRPHDGERHRISASPGLKSDEFWQLRCLFALQQYADRALRRLRQANGRKAESSAQLEVRLVETGQTAILGRFLRRHPSPALFQRFHDR